MASRQLRPKTMKYLPPELALKDGRKIGISAKKLPDGRFQPVLTSPEGKKIPARAVKAMNWYQARREGLRIAINVKKTYED